ncbi:MAG TPA: DUF255 domain-containing protein [Chthoniobacteraceae bacterium]|nr:DUF255 domain-containing protein [Chthoniobacteraceae bacterium]
MQSKIRLLRPVYWIAALLLFARAAKADIAWQDWSPKVFEQAKVEKKLVILDLAAVWCHWCHVMDANTYSDPAVQKLLRAGYIAVRADQDAHPALSARYEDYGWPATIIFDGNGRELAKRQGYIPPKMMASMLKAFIDDPTPGPSATATPAIVESAGNGLTDTQRAAMQKKFLGAYDPKLGAWGHTDKFLDWDAVEYCLVSGHEGMARQTLQAAELLIDPVWGGMDQYSTGGDWTHPHFEKIMPVQAESIRIYAIAATSLRDPRWLEPAQKIRGYVKNFLTSPDGAFYVSQDADLVDGRNSAAYYALSGAARRARGVPRIDRHIYASSNGRAIACLCALYDAGGGRGCLVDAQRAARWILASRSLPGGGFRHDQRDAGGPYLADTLEMGRAFFALYQSTADRAWLARAEAAADFIEAHFNAGTGFASTAPQAGDPLAPEPNIDENIGLARFAVRLGFAAGNSKYRAMANHAMRYLAAPAVIASQGFAVGGILLADRELRSEPVHVVIVGSKENAGAAALYSAALRSAPPFARVEWYDRKEGPLPGNDVTYPDLPGATAFLCSGSACSSPIKTPAQLTARLLAAAASR